MGIVLLERGSALAGSVFAIRDLFCTVRPQAGEVSVNANGEPKPTDAKDELHIPEDLLGASSAVWEDEATLK